MNTEQRSIPTKPINERTLALVTAVAALLIGALPGTAYSGQYLNDYLKGRGWTGLAFSLYHGPEEQKYPNGERSVVECWGSNCVQNYDQCHCFVTFWDERGNVEYQEEWWGDKRAQTTYDDKGKSTTVIGDPSTGSKEVIIKDFDGVVISDTTYTFDHLGNIKTATAKDKCGTITSQVTCTYTYDDKGVASRLCKDEHGVEKHFDPSTLGLAEVPDGNGPAGSGRGQAGQVGSPGGVGIGNTQAIAPDSASAIGGPAGVVGTNAAVVRHPGQSIKGLKPAQGVAAPSGSSGTAGVASPGTTTSSGDSGFATGSAAGVAGPNATPSGAGNSATGGTEAVAGANRGEPQREPTPNSRNKKLIKRTVTNVGSSSSAENSAVGGTAGVAGPVTATGSSGSGSSRLKSRSKKSQGAASSTANIQGSGQSTETAHPTPSPSNRKKKDSSDQP